MRRLALIWCTSRVVVVGVASCGMSRTRPGLLGFASTAATATAIISGLMMWRLMMMVPALLLTSARSATAACTTRLVPSLVQIDHWSHHERVLMMKSYIMMKSADATTHTATAVASRTTRTTKWFGVFIKLRAFVNRLLKIGKNYYLGYNFFEEKK